MKLSKEIVKVLHDKNLTTFIVKGLRDGEPPHITAIVEMKAHGERHDLYFNHQVDVVINNHAQQKMINYFCFHMSIYRNFEQAYNKHVSDFLKKITPNKEVNFDVVAFNNSDATREVGHDRHELYGTINGQKYLLMVWQGKPNFASPIKEFDTK